MRSDLSNLNPELVLNVSTSQTTISQVNNLIFGLPIQKYGLIKMT